MDYTPSSNSSNSIHHQPLVIGTTTTTTSSRLASIRRHSLIVSTKKRWSITSTSSLNSKSCGSNLGTPNRVATTRRLARFGPTLSFDEEPESSGVLGEQLGAQSAPALLSERAPSDEPTTSSRPFISVNETKRLIDDHNPEVDKVSSCSHLEGPPLDDATKLGSCCIETNQQSRENALTTNPNDHTKLMLKPNQPKLNHQINSGPIVQVKESSSSSASTSVASSRVNSNENLANNQELEAQNNQDSQNSDPNSDLEEVTKSSQNRIIKRRTIKTRRTRSKHSATCEEEKLEPEVPDRQRSSEAKNSQSNSFRSLSSLSTSASNSNITSANTFFRTRQIGTNQTSSSSSTSSKTVKSSSSLFHQKTQTKSSTQVSHQQQQQQQQQQQKHDTIMQDSTGSGALLRNKSSLIDDLKSGLMKGPAVDSSPTSSFPFEIERATPMSTGGCSRVEQIAEAESRVSHSESFSTSSSSSLRSSALAASNDAALNNTQCSSTSSSSSNPSTLKADDHDPWDSRRPGSLWYRSQALKGSETSSSSSLMSSSCHQMSGSLSNSASTATVIEANSNKAISTSAMAESHQHQHKISAASMSSSSTTSSTTKRHQEEYSSSASSITSMSKFQLESASAQSNAFHLLVSSPDVRSLAKEIGTDFAKLESCLARGTGSGSSSKLASYHLTGTPEILHPESTRLSSALSSQLFGLTNRTRLQAGLNSPSIQEVDLETDDRPLSIESCEPKAIMGPSDNGLTPSPSINQSTTSQSNRIIELMNKANTQKGDMPRAVQLNQRSSAAMNESIERIEHKLSGLCRKLDDCQEITQAIELLEVLIQMIEKAWSVPVCGDDLGFRLCACLRESGGLRFILGLIKDAQDSSNGRLLLSPLTTTTTTKLDNEDNNNNNNDSPGKQIVDKSQQVDQTGELKCTAKQQATTIPLKLKIPSSSIVYNPPEDVSGWSGCRLVRPSRNTSENNSNCNSPVSSPPVANQVKDSDSEILTSDLGLDSASVDSFSYSNGLVHQQDDEASGSTETVRSKLAGADVAAAGDKQTETGSSKFNHIEQQEGGKTTTDKGLTDDSQVPRQGAEVDPTLQKDELIFLSARLLSQCLTTDNRDYLVRRGWLEPVVKLACTLATVKSGQVHKRLLLGQSRCLLTLRQGSAMGGIPAAGRSRLTQPEAGQGPDDLRRGLQPDAGDLSPGASLSMLTNEQQPREPAQGPEASDQQADLLASIGTEILQHLFKHSEETCKSIIGMGGLEAILFGCRSSSVETLRHCASALANLALHGGPDSHEMMIEHKAHVWLFPLAFNEDDNVQYYACLAIVILVANQEIEADVLKSTTLNLVEPFVTSHEPRRFAESDTAHIHGQSGSWLRRLLPLLDSKRVEARNLAAFHFAMEAYVKREQGQTHIFKDIGAIEPLRKLGSSPNAIASKFACQALRLIGEKEPHRLSQQVPLWTTEDVVQWVGQVGFKTMEARFHESGVDGDLLLQLDELMLERDIGIQNGITRRRFLRELGQLKRISDYSSLDHTGLCSLLGAENLQYAYPMLKFGVTRDNIHQLDAGDLLEECGIPNTIHRSILSRTIKGLQEKMAQKAQSEANSINGADRANQKTLDVFVSYRRSNGSQLASLLKVHLQLRNLSVFIDVERLEAGKFDNNLLDSIRQAKNFILVLSPNALDRCIDDFECKDWVHKEIVAALEADCNIIPIMYNFHWPEPEKLPEDMRSIAYYNGVPWYHDYQDACVDKIERFIRGDLSNANQQQQQLLNSHLNSNNNNNNINNLSINGAPSCLTSSVQQQQLHSLPGNCGSLKRNQFASPTPSLTPSMHSDYGGSQANPLSAQPVMVYQGAHQTPAPVGQNLFLQQQLIKR